MTDLTQHLMARIAASGPISLADFMAEALMHPTMGYYSTRDPFGADGDFVTAPETSQMFGELLGLCLAQAWMDQGAPSAFALVELGPGRGTLMADLIRATKGVPGFLDAADVHFVETSPTLRSAQQKQVPHASWHDTLDTIPDLPLFAVANEFFDALPIRQFQRADAGWHEVQVGLKDGTLAAGLSDPAPLAFLDDRIPDTSPGDIVEYCPSASAICTTLGSGIANRGGAALIIDYGDWRSLGDTFQALKNHRPVDPFEAPGTADLTAHVDFERVAKSVAPARYTRLTPQGVFLERLGITQRARTLAKQLSGAALDNHIAAHRRLTHPAEMGTLFKVMGVYPDGAPVPAGLEP